jgi:transposase InsO family protein
MKECKRLQRLQTSFSTPGDNRLVREYIKGCSVCQRNKTDHLHPTGLLQPLPVPSSVWTDIAMDFVEGFPKVGGKSVILTVVDRFSKFAHFIPVGHPYSAASVAKAFFDNIVRLHGFPASIVSDRDPVFTSHLWTELFRLSGTRLCTSSAFHPQTDGQSEVTNKTITIYLRCLAGDRPRSWLRWLPWAEFCYNTSLQSALKTTPFEVVYGRPPPPLLPFQSGSTKVAAVDKQLRDRDTFIANIKERLLQAQSIMKTYHDQSHRQVEFQVGNWVWLRLNHRTASAIRPAGQNKLSPKYYGPYEVMEKIGAVAYRLQLPPKAQIHNVFHVVFLKKFEGTPPTEPTPLPPIVRGRAVAQPDRVVRARSAGSSWEIPVQWKGKSMAEATWEPLQQFKEDYPNVKLEDELFRQEGVVLWTPSSVVSMLGDTGRSTTRIRCVMEIESKSIRESLSC